MKAIVNTRYGSPDVLRLRDVPKPVPREHEVLVHVHATTVTIGDTIMRSLNIPGPVWQRLFARLYGDSQTQKNHSGDGTGWRDRSCGQESNSLQAW